MLLRSTICLLFLLLLGSEALAEKRIALVIGNSAYQYAPKLANPKNDATDMAAALKKLDFQTIEGFDLDKVSLDRKIRDFATALQGADVGVFFYAGHGLQVAGQNYLVPVDAKAETASALDFEMVRLDLVQRTMEREASTNVLFLDACRDNPLVRNLARALGTRSTDVGRGLAAVESGSGTLISFSTQPGNVAADGSGRNSPFTGPLVSHMTTSNDDLSAVLIAVRNDVMTATQGKQVPWEHSALTKRVYFNSAAQTASPPPVAPMRLSEAAEAWGATKDNTSVAILEAYIVRYKDTFYAELARARIDELKKQQETSAPSWWERITGSSSPAPPLKSGIPDQVWQPAPPKPKEIAAAISPARCDGVDTQVGSEKRCLKPKDGFRDCANCPEMVVVPAGEFAMGSEISEEGRDASESPQHKVVISAPFAAGIYELTLNEFDEFVEATGRKLTGCWFWRGDRWLLGRELSYKNPGFSQDGRHPVVCVNWEDAKAYTKWLSEKTGRGYRLLTEAEREYLTRAGKPGPFWWGTSISPELANFNSAKGQNPKGTVTVDSFKPNPWGFYNAHGNVWDWVEDCWHNDYKGAPTDGSAWTNTCSEPRRVVRGGSWVDPPFWLRAARRGRHDPGGVPSTDGRGFNTGFRVARDLTR